MSENQNRVQLMTIPAPLFKHGDLVEWFYCSERVSCIFRGLIVDRAYLEENPGKSGYWDYGIDLCVDLCETPKPWNPGYDTVQEQELKYAVFASQTAPVSDDSGRDQIGQVLLTA